MRVSYVCDMTWDSLEGDDPIERHCGTCDKSVFNLLGMSAGEAADFLATRGLDPSCVRFQLEDGRIAHAAPSQLRSQGIGAIKLVAAATLLNLGIATLLQNPYGLLIGPYTVVLESYTRNRDVKGSPMFDVEDLKRDLADCDRDTCPEFARATYLRADQRLSSNTSTAVYDAYRDFLLAAVVLDLWEIPPEEAGIPDVHERVETLATALDARFTKLTRSYEEHRARGEYPPSREWDDFKATFSDDQNRWMEWVGERERERWLTQDE